MFSPFLLTFEEHQTLSDAVASASSYRLRQRAGAIPAQSRGASVGQLALHCGRDRETICRWIHAWEDHGLAGLLEPRRTGRPSLLGETAQKND